MNKGTITIELPILDDVNQMEVVNTFNKKQLWYVCAIAKAFEKSQQELQRKDNIINGIKIYLKDNIKVCDNRLSTPFCNFEKTTKERMLFQNSLDKIKELENDVK